MGGSTAAPLHSPDKFHMLSNCYWYIVSQAEAFKQVAAVQLIWNVIPNCMILPNAAQSDNVLN